MPVDKYNISVIIPSFKPQGYLWECLDSLIAQTLPKDQFEVILVLNGCREPWIEQINTYLAKHIGDINIQFIQTDIPGVSNARNMALDRIQGEYVTFIDDDDYISPYYLEGMLHASSPSVIGVARPVAFREGVNFAQYYKLTEQFDKLYPAVEIPYLKLRVFFSGPWLKLIHKSIIGSRRFDPDFSLGEDGLFNFLISDEFNKCTLVSPNAIYYRRYRDGSLIMKRQDKRFLIKNNLRMLKEISIIFFSAPFKYSFRFYVMQSLSCLIGMFH